MKSLNVGTLVHDVTIEQLSVDAVDATGAPAPGTWVTLCRAQMSRDASRGDRSGEAFQANQLSGSTVMRWAMRYLRTMDPDLVDVQKERRLRYQGRVHDIVSADVLERQAGILLRTLVASKVSS